MGEFYILHEKLGRVFHWDEFLYEKHVLNFLLCTKHIRDIGDMLLEIM